MDILYHYCSSASFHAIAQSHSIWLSSLSLSNDTMEGKLVANVIERLAKRDSLDQDAVRGLREVIGFFEEIADGLGFCLSKDGDLLSQWRGYAADATGVAIGFSTEYLKWLSEKSKLGSEPGFTLQEVEYEPSAHELCVEPTYQRAKQFIDAGAFKSPTSHGANLLFSRTTQEIEQENTAILNAHSGLFKTTILLLPELFRLKAYAFREEREWRLLSYPAKGGKDNCLHRALHDRIVPYRNVELVELTRNPIAEVILGPKHGTPEKVVADFLRQNHYGDVQVRRSAASYR